MTQECASLARKIETFLWQRIFVGGLLESRYAALEIQMWGNSFETSSATLLTK